MRSFNTFQLICFILGALFVSSDSVASNEVWALTAFKEAIYEDPFMVLSNWDALDADPCDWTGISCSPGRDHVTTLNLSSSSLKGFLAPELGLLSSLEKLILHKNNFLGTIPKEIGMLKSLKVLDLGINQLSGPIPPEIGNLSSANKIHLQFNGLTGSVPIELGNLRNLVDLRLDRNKLQGTIPGYNNLNFTSNRNGCMYASDSNATGVCRASQLKNANFSFNFFVGRIPQCLKYLPRSSFQGNCFQDRDPKQRSTQQCGVTKPAKPHPGPNAEHPHVENVSKHQRTSKPGWLLALEIITGSAAGFLLLFAILTTIKKCKGQSPVIIPWKKAANMKDPTIMYIDSEKLKDVVSWSRQELEVACEDFSNIIGSSPDSLVYKGIVKDGPEIAVISLCVKEENWTGYLELYFQREVADLARLNHENIGKLLGYCRESSPFSRMLVFRYASNGTLNEHLHYGEGCQLSWTQRMKIIIGIARGLRYLHTELQPPFTISELNSSAVYLTEDFSPKLVDFENWKTVLARSEKNSTTISNVDFTFGFSDSLQTRHLDVQGNTFAFGVLLLEIISGRPPYCKDRGCLVDWAKEYLEQPEVLSYLVDPELRHFRYDELKVICEVVNLSIQIDASKRPSMHALCNILESRIDTSTSSELKDSPLAWAELAISS
ncbi:Protein kinase domain [Macleaya cordata]|uniref:Protein kinase domain n=1 Tax=Macleaya cordata TaxID=56857 RepID=A0A200QRR8_MACCD|nr:Protein kinase domain [Macleaya cordata]